MKISDHADRTEELYGLRAEDIHKWIDGFFDQESFEAFIAAGVTDNYDPYEHRSYRHCREALDEAYEEFEGKYTKDEIKKIFESHLKDDYEGYLPHRKDFLDGSFHERFHESDLYSKEDPILTGKELSEYFYSDHYKASSKKAFSGFNLKIILPVILIFLIFVTTVFSLIIPVYKDTVIGRKKEMIRELLSLAVNIIEQYQDKVKTGDLTLEEAQKLAADEVSRLSYGVEGKDYFWITDMQPVMIMHPYRKDLVGKDLSHYSDSKTRSGKLIFVELVHIVKEQGEGFLKYDWQWMDDSTRIDPKISYVRGIPQWNWTVGTGIYLTDVEEEIHNLAENMTSLFILISIIISGFLFFVVIQSRKIEERRKLAEMGLKEAKDRYRALVEASSEGHVLFAGKRNIYSNITVQRMTGYSAQELAADDIWKKLFPDNYINRNLLAHLDQIIDDSAGPSEFEAQLETKNGHLLDIIVSTSHIFFAEKNGHVISFRPIVSIKKGSLGNQNSEILNYEDIIREIEGSNNYGHIIRMINQFILTIRKSAAREGEFNKFRFLISQTYEIAARQFIKIAIEEFGKPPVSFSFLSLGSIARGEMTLFSDQDNAIVFEDVSESEEKRVKRYFLRLAKEVCSKLDQAGYPFCPGGIMAMNPKWCLSISQWKKRFVNWINNSNAQALLDINVFFDIKNLYGRNEYSEELLDLIVDQSSKKPEFLMHFSRNALNYKVPSGKRINIKNCLIPIVNFARIFSIREGIKEPQTRVRLESLLNLGILSETSYTDVLNNFEILWHFRFYNQLFAHADLRVVNDELNLEDISKEDSKKIKEAISYLSVIQSRLSYDFLGIDFS